MVATLSVKVAFSDDYHKKLGFKNKKDFYKVIDPAVDHTLHDAENIIKREAPRPGHSMSKSIPPYKPTGNLQRSFHKNKPSKGSGELKSKAPYWVYVQYGTSKMPANPFVTRTARKVSPNLQKYVLEELKRANIIE